MRKIRRARGFVFDLRSENFEFNYEFLKKGNKDFGDNFFTPRWNVSRRTVFACKSYGGKRGCIELVNRSDANIVIDVGIRA